MELDAVDQRVVGDGSRVRGAAPERLAVLLARPAHVGRGDAGERNQLHLVDLEGRRADRVPAADLDLRPAPEPVRDRDAAGRHAVAKLGAELHEPRLEERLQPRQRSHAARRRLA